MDLVAMLVDRAGRRDIGPREVGPCEVIPGEVGPCDGQRTITGARLSSFHIAASGTAP